jgi:hypothetical protein
MVVEAEVEVVTEMEQEDLEEVEQVEEIQEQLIQEVEVEQVVIQLQQVPAVRES